MTIDKLIEKIKAEKQVIIYGAGWGGKIVYEFLNEKGIKIDAFTVTIQNEQRKIEGLPIYGLDYCLAKFSEAFILIAVTKMIQPDLIENLKKGTFPIFWLFLKLLYMKCEVGY